MGCWAAAESGTKREVCDAVLRGDNICMESIDHILEDLTLLAYTLNGLADGTQSVPLACCILDYMPRNVPIRSQRVEYTYI